jgi:hypothetical protein
MAGLSPELYTSCRDTLRRCQEFFSYQTLRAVFVTKQLFPFRIGLPSAGSPEQLVDLLLDHLIEKRLSNGNPVLPAFLATLRDRYDPADSLHQDLNDLYIAAQAAMTPPRPQIRSSPRRRQLLFDRLLQLDFRSQVRLFREVIEEHRVAAFLIHGPPGHGQRMLTCRLARFKPEWETGQHIPVEVSSNGIGKSSRALWGQVAKKLQLPYWTSPKDLAAKVGEWWRTQDVIFIFHTVDYMPTDLLSAWIEEFWGPLVTMANQAQNQTYRRTHLLLFLVDYAGTVCQSDMPLAQHPHDLRTVAWPLLLPTIEPFPELELEIWLDAAAEVLTSGLSVGTLLSEPYNGIPEFVYEKICEHCGLGWEGEIAV